MRTTINNWNLVCKAVVLMYVACADRIGELHDILWEDIKQIEYEGKQLWMFSYFKEKQDGRPGKVESILGDEISNMVFSLYTGDKCIFENVCIYQFISFCLVMHVRMFQERRSCGPGFQILDVGA